MESALTLAEGGLCPSCSLNVFVQTPIPAPQPITPITPTTTTPGAWLRPEGTSAPNQPEVGQEEGPMDVDDEEEPDQAEEEDGQGEDDNEDGEDDEDDEDDDDEMMHALPVQFNPGHHGMPGRGRGGMPFSGAGHSLSGGSRSTTEAASASGDATTPLRELTAEEADSQRRQRFLEAMENRAKTQEQDQSRVASGPSKHLKPKEVPSLRSRCAYEVAGMFLIPLTKMNHNVFSSCANTQF